MRVRGRLSSTGVRLTIIGIAALLLLVTVGLGATAWAWGDSLREEQRLLPGTTVAAIDVGGLELSAAIAAVEDHLSAQLDRVVTVTDGDEAWDTTARELGADTDAEQVVAAAFGRTQEASLRELTRLRWAGPRAGVDLDVDIAIPDGRIEAFVADIADDVDRDARDATLTWAEGTVEVEDSRPGQQVDREATVIALATAVNGTSDTVQLTVEELAPSTTTETAQAVADEVEERVERGLGHEVTLDLDGSTWTVTPRELGATPVVEPLLEAGLASGGALDELPDLELAVPDDPVASFVARIASEVDRPSRDAQIDLASGEMTVTPERNGLALDRASARDDLRVALAGASDHVTLTTSVTTPSITSRSFERILYLDQSARELALIEDGDVIGSWPVAVGMGGSPTPTGTFTVGAKRYEPTWYNPAQDRWGADMPAKMGPGPDNPLGARAINWNRNGRDTLIRFHGTPNEDSIGEAASRGCVRMYNADVIELYDLVSTGTTIVSVG